MELVTLYGAVLRLGAAWFRSGTAYFRLAAAGVPLPEDLVPPWARLVLASLTRKPPKRRKDLIAR
jgi:hypothetical protein